MKSISKLVMASFAVSALVLSGCSSPGTAGSSGEIEVQAESVDTEKVGILIDFPGNFFFSTYDVELFVDAKYIATLPHGEDQEIVLDLENGEHSAWFVSENDSEVRGEVDFSVEGTTELKYKINCTSLEIQVERIDRISSPIASSDAIGMKRDELESSLRDAGFTDVTLEEVRDLDLADADKQDAVKSVSIGGKEDFSREDEFYPTDEVKITYHVMGDLKIPASSSDLIGLNIDEVTKLFEDAGFKNVNPRDESPAENEEDANKVNKVVIWRSALSMSSDFSKGEECPAETKVMIYYTPPKLEPSPGLEKVEKEQAAKDLFESYGELLYPKFKCHWWTGMLNFEDQGDGTYFIKVEVTIKDNYGQERRTVAQGIAGNGNVTDFYVS